MSDMNVKPIEQIRQAMGVEEPESHDAYIENGPTLKCPKQTVAARAGRMWHKLLCTVAGFGLDIITVTANGTGSQPVEYPQWQRVVDILHANYEKPDVEGARLICAAMAAHALSQFPPAWTLAIAPPGSMKTDLLESLRGLPKVHFVDEITPKTFLSGKVDEPNRTRTRPASYLHRIGSDGILVAADFSTFTADVKALQIVLAQLRRIYDGNYSREFGTDDNTEERSWSGRITLLAGAVPDIDKHNDLFQKLGERFIRVRWARAGGVEAGLRAMRHTDALAPKLRAAVHDLLGPILAIPREQVSAPTLGEAMELRISSLSELIALSRSHVERDRYTREVVGMPITEGNTRLPQQLCQVARGSALLDGRGEVNDADFKLVWRVALDCLPPSRRGVLEAIIAGQSPYGIGLPDSTAERAVADLKLVGVAMVPPNAKASLTDAASRLLAQAGAA